MTKYYFPVRRVSGKAHLLWLFRRGAKLQLIDKNGDPPQDGEATIKARGGLVFATVKDGLIIRT